MDQRQRNELDRYITGNYGEDSVPDEQTGVLREPCEILLKQHDMYSVENRFDADFADIYDCEGDLLFGVTIDIPINCLRSIIQYGTKQFEAGQRVGAATIQAGLQKLLNVAPIPDEPAE